MTYAIASPGEPETNLPVESSPNSSISGFLHRMVESADQRPAVAVVGGPTPG